MKKPAFLLPVLTLALCGAALSAAHGRLGETEAQSQTRYGTPTPDLTVPNDRPLMQGAKEVIYRFQGYRIRAALVNDVTVRIEYANLPAGERMPKQLTDVEIKAILDAEKGVPTTNTWREDKNARGSGANDNRRGNGRGDWLGRAINDFRNAAEGRGETRSWERTDHAQASLRHNALLQLETKDADAIEKRLAKPQGLGPGLPTPGPSLPKF